MADLYDLLGPLYDTFNSDVPYDEITEYLLRAFHTYGEEIHTVLDLGCGTGRITVALADTGLDMIGLDLSQEMLSTAYDCAEGRDILWTNQDMCDFELVQNVDAVICTLDGINHLPDLASLRRTFACVAQHLNEGGLFCFDVNSLYRFEIEYGDNAYTYESRDAFCVWQNDYHPRSAFCDFYVTLFRHTANGLYQRFDSVQRERYFSILTLRHALADAGFSLCGVFGDTDFTPYDEASPKWYFVAKKMQLS